MPFTDLSSADRVFTGIVTHAFPNSPAQMGIFGALLGGIGIVVAACAAIAWTVYTLIPHG